MDKMCTFSAVAYLGLQLQCYWSALGGVIDVLCSDWLVLIILKKTEVNGQVYDHSETLKRSQ